MDALPLSKLYKDQSEKQEYNTPSWEIYCGMNSMKPTEGRKLYSQEYAARLIHTQLYSKYLNKSANIMP